ncbi:MAG: helix-turn-helix domain-containing protein [Sciscionella sp.]
MSGFVFRLMRESAELTQVELAHELSVDVATVQGWESGRRAIGSLRASDIARLQMRMGRLGVRLSLFDVLHDAVEADLLISDAVQAGDSLVPPERHPLAAEVHRRSLTSLITWPITGAQPPQLAGVAPYRRRGPAPKYPQLTVEERDRFFNHLLVTADAQRRRSDALLRRQAIYLLSFDHRPDSAGWLASEQQQAMRKASAGADHVPSWVSVRSSAVALAYKGNREPLYHFVSGALVNEKQELANLNYWAYWVGEIPEKHVDDQFMVSDGTPHWTGAWLADHLLNRISPGLHHVELNIHTLWALLLARPAVLDCRPDLRPRIEATADTMTVDLDISKRARQELDSIAYAVRMTNR